MEKSKSSAKVLCWVLWKDDKIIGISVIKTQKMHKKEAGGKSKDICRFCSRNTKESHDVSLRGFRSGVWT